MNPRYALYFVPDADSALYRFGAAALGCDSYTGNDVDFPDRLPIETDAWRELTRVPRGYGFHATLKAPFHLADGCDETALIDALPAFCRSIASAPLFEPIVASLMGFIALVPAVANPAIDRLAAACVTAFDRFRAPLRDEDRDRRRVGLTQRQADNLDRWGYPFVFDDFRLHLTLTAGSGRTAMPSSSPIFGAALPLFGKRVRWRSTASRCCGRVGRTPASSSSAMRQLARPGSMATHDRVSKMLI